MGFLDSFRRKPPTSARGESGRGNASARSGARSFTSLQPDEFNAKLTGQAGYDVFDQMWRGDADVRRSLLMVMNPIIGATWEVEPYGGEDADDVARKHAEFVEWALFERMSPRFPAHVSELMRVGGRHGFAPFEQIWKKDVWERQIKPDPKAAPEQPEKPGKKGPPDPTKLAAPFGDKPADDVESGEDADGIKTESMDVLTLDILGLRLPSSIYEWHAIDDRLESITQNTAQKGAVTLPLDDLAYYRFGAEGDNWEGESLLRGAYKAWKMKDTLEWIEAVALERYRVGLPVVYPPSGANDDDLDEIEAAIQQIRANSQGYLIMPGPKQGDAADGGWLLEILTPGSGEGSALTEAIQGHRDAISANIVAEFMRLGQSGTGARATADVQQDPFLAYLEAIAGIVIEDTVNASLIPRLVALNFPADEIKGLPKISCSLIDATSLEELGAFVSGLIGSGALKVDNDLEDYLRERADLPPADPEARKIAEQQALDMHDAEIESKLKPPAFDPTGKPVEPRGPFGKQRPGAPPTKLSQGADLSRLRGYHDFMALEALQGTLDGARDALKAAVASELPEIVQAIVRGGSGSTASLTFAIQAALTEIYLDGRESVRQECERQVAAPVPEGPQTFAAGDSSLPERAAQIADNIVGAIARVVGLWKLGGESDEGRLLSLGEIAGQDAAGREALDHASSALGEGRRAEADRIGDGIAGVFYTSILDKNRCAACARADDDVLRRLDDPVRLRRIPPNVDCEGWMKCRCMEFYVFEGDADALRLAAVGSRFDESKVKRDRKGRFSKKAWIGGIRLGDLNVGDKFHPPIATTGLEGEARGGEWEVTRHADGMVFAKKTGVPEAGEVPFGVSTKVEVHVNAAGAANMGITFPGDDPVGASARVRAKELARHDEFLDAVGARWKVLHVRAGGGVEAEKQDDVGGIDPKWHVTNFAAEDKVQPVKTDGGVERMNTLYDKLTKVGDRFNHGGKEYEVVRFEPRAGLPDRIVAQDVLAGGAGSRDQYQIRFGPEDVIDDHRVGAERIPDLKVGDRFNGVAPGLMGKKRWEVTRAEDERDLLHAREVVDGKMRETGPAMVFGPDVEIDAVERAVEPEPGIDAADLKVGDEFRLPGGHLLRVLKADPNGQVDYAYVEGGHGHPQGAYAGAIAAKNRKVFLVNPNPERDMPGDRGVYPKTGEARARDLEMNPGWVVQINGHPDEWKLKKKRDNGYWEAELADGRKGVISPLDRVKLVRVMGASTPQGETKLRDLDLSPGDRVDLGDDGIWNLKEKRSDGGWDALDDNGAAGILNPSDPAKVLDPAPKREHGGTPSNPVRIADGRDLHPGDLVRLYKEDDDHYVVGADRNLYREQPNGIMNQAGDVGNVSYYKVGEFEGKLPGRVTPGIGDRVAVADVEIGNAFMIGDDYYIAEGRDADGRYVGRDADDRRVRLNWDNSVVVAPARALVADVEEGDRVKLYPHQDLVYVAGPKAEPGGLRVFAPAHDADNFIPELRSEVSVYPVAEAGASDSPTFRPVPLTRIDQLRNAKPGDRVRLWERESRDQRDFVVGQDGNLYYAKDDPNGAYKKGEPYANERADNEAYAAWSVWKIGEGDVAPKGDGRGTVDPKPLNPNDGAALIADDALMDFLKHGDSADSQNAPPYVVVRSEHGLYDVIDRDGGLLAQGAEREEADRVALKENLRVAQNRGLAPTGIAPGRLARHIQGAGGVPLGPGTEDRLREAGEARRPPDYKVVERADGKFQVVRPNGDATGQPFYAREGAQRQVESLRKRSLRRIEEGARDEQRVADDVHAHNIRERDRVAIALLGPPGSQGRGRADRMEQLRGTHVIGEDGMEYVIDDKRPLDKGLKGHEDEQWLRIRPVGGGRVKKVPVEKVRKAGPMDRKIGAPDADAMRAQERSNPRLDESVPQLPGDLPPAEGVAQGNLLGPPDTGQTPLPAAPPIEEWPDSTRAAHRETVVENLERVLGSGEVTMGAKIGGSTGAVYHVTVDGIPAVLKPDRGTMHGLRDHIADSNSAGRDRAATMIGHALGLPVPVSTIRTVDLSGFTYQRKKSGGGTVDVQGTADERCTVMEFLDWCHDFGDKPGDRYPDSTNKQDRRIALLDAIAGNTDRHSKNWMVDDESGENVPIDHNLSFPEADGGWGNFTFINACAGARLDEQERAILDSLAEQWENTIRPKFEACGLTALEISESRRRLEFIRSSGRFPKKSDFGWSGN